MSTRQCAVQIINDSNYTLHDPSWHLISGHCKTTLPTALLPFESGSCLFAKTVDTMRGSVGVFTYTMKNESTKKDDNKMAVMFSVPYDYNLYDTLQAVGIYGMDRICDDSLYEEMYNGKEIGFVRGKASGIRLIYEKDDVTIKSTMTDDEQSVLKVEVCSVKP